MISQFAGDEAPFNSWPAICRWAAGLGYRGIQLPAGDDRFLSLGRAAESKDYCDEVAGVGREHGIEITELSTHRFGQLVAVHPAFDGAFDVFAPEALRGRPQARQRWAVGQLELAARASRNLGLNVAASFTGALAWPLFYPWPPRPPGLIEEAFAELARRWRPILDVFDDAGVDVAYELHPGEDTFDGATFERFLESVGNHPRCAINYDPSHFVLQKLDYLAFIDLYHPWIRGFHVKDAEFNPDGRQGAYSGFEFVARSGGALPLAGRRASRFRRGVLEAGGLWLRRLGGDGVGVLPQASRGWRARGRPFIAAHIIRTTDKAFDDFAGGASDAGRPRRSLGLEDAKKRAP